MVVWEWEEPNPIEEIFMPIYKKRSGQYLKDVRESIKLLSMYLFILRGKFSNAEDLRNSVLKNGKPILSSEDSAHVFKKLGKKKLQKGGDPPIPHREPGNEIILKQMAGLISFLDIFNFMGSLENFENNMKLYLEEKKKENPKAGLLVEIASRSSQGAAEGVDGLASTFGGILGQTLVAPMTLLLATFSAALQVAKGDRGSALKSFLDVTPGVDVIAGPLEQYNALIAKLSPQELEEFFEMFSLSGLPVGQKLNNLKNNLNEKYDPQNLTPNLSRSIADSLENLASNLRQKFKYKPVDKRLYLGDFMEHMDRLIKENPEFEEELRQKLGVVKEEPKGGTRRKRFSRVASRTVRNVGRDKVVSS